VQLPNGDSGALYLRHNPLPFALTQLQPKTEWSVLQTFTSKSYLCPLKLYFYTEDGVNTFSRAIDSVYQNPRRHIP